tara:strand:- start:4571 stop:4783 length:213 start_codon:yes stop_codon:yes gene_type:complete
MYYLYEEKASSGGTAFCLATKEDVFYANRYREKLATKTEIIKQFIAFNNAIKLTKEEYNLILSIMEKMKK